MEGGGEQVEVEALWRGMFERTALSCMHGSKCKLGPSCEAGRRVRTVHLLSGSTLPIWATVETALKAEARVRSFSVIRVAETEDASGVAAAAKQSLLPPDDAPPPPPPGSAGSVVSPEKEGQPSAADAALEDNQQLADPDDGGGAKSAAQVVPCTAGKAEKSPAVKVVGISLPNKHAAKVLEAIAVRVLSGSMALGTHPSLC